MDFGARGGTTLKPEQRSSIATPNMLHRSIERNGRLHLSRLCPNAETAVVERTQEDLQRHGPA